MCLTLVLFQHRPLFIPLKRPPSPSGTFRRQKKLSTGTLRLHLYDQEKAISDSTGTSSPPPISTRLLLCLNFSSSLLHPNFYSCPRLLHFTSTSLFHTPLPCFVSTPLFSLNFLHLSLYLSSQLLFFAQFRYFAVTLPTLTVDHICEGNRRIPAFL